MALLLDVGSEVSRQSLHLGSLLLGSSSIIIFSCRSVSLVSITTRYHDEEIEKSHVWGRDEL